MVAIQRDGVLMAAAVFPVLAYLLCRFIIAVDRPVSKTLSLFINFVLQQTKQRCRELQTDYEVKPVPRIEYKWPNGQGTEKFFTGRAASRRWIEEKGPVYQICAGFKPEVVLTQPEHLREFYRDSDKHIKAINNNGGWLFGEILGSCLGLVSGARWERVRTPFNHPFSLPMSLTYTDLIISHAQDYVRDYIDRFKDPRQDLELDVVDALKLHPFLIVAHILFGRLSKDQKSILTELVPVREDLFREGIKGGVNRTPLAKWLGTKGYRMLMDYKVKWRAFVVNAYEESKSLGKNGAIEQLWNHVKTDEILTEEECLQTLDEALYANIDVTTSSVAWSHVLLAQHGSIQEELRQEIMKHKRLSDEEWGGYINRGDTLLAGCILEASRLRPILPFSNPEASTTDKMVGGVMIPQNVDVIVDTHAINVENPFWIEGERFNPRRFINLRPQQYRYHFWRFGFGPRQCLGKYIGDRMVRALLAEMLSKYRISLAEAEPDHDFGLQSESWVGLPLVRMRCSTLGE